MDKIQNPKMIFFQKPKILIFNLGKLIHFKIVYIQTEISILINRMTEIIKLIIYLLMIEKIKMIITIKK
jgi:hypothetical protein